MKSFFRNIKSSSTFYGTWSKYEKLGENSLPNAPITDACNPFNYANYDLLNIS